MGSFSYFMFFYVFFLELFVESIALYSPINSNCNIYSGLRAFGIESYTPEISGYEEAAFQYGHLMVDFSDLMSPDYIAFATNNSEISLILSFVSGCNDIDNIVIRSGGHQYSGLSSCNKNCLQLDVSGFDTIEIIDDLYDDSRNPLTDGYDTALVKIGSGVDLETAYGTLANYGLILFAGACEGVHIGGNYQSSAHGIYGHSFGSGMDYIKSFDIVLADGSIKTITKKNDGDLFWAMKGGSPGAWGIVTSYNVELFYDSNFPYNTLSTTYYRYNKETVIQLGYLYNLALSSNEYGNGRDGGAVYIQCIPVYAAPDGLRETFESLGDTHFLLLYVTYSGKDSQIEFESSDIYNNVLVPYFRSGNYGVVPFYINDIGPIPPSWMLDMILFPWSDFEGGYRHAMGSKQFSNETYTLWANGLDELMNEGYTIITQIMGSIGGALESNDPNNKLSAHPYRDTVSFIDSWVRVIPDTLTNEDELIETAQIKTDIIYDGLYDLIDESDRDKRWLMYTFGETDINKVWQNYYPNQEIYDKLRCIKGRVDPYNLFSSPFTVKPKFGPKCQRGSSDDSDDSDDSSSRAKGKSSNSSSSD